VSNPIGKAEVYTVGANYRFSDLVDVAAYSQLLESFFKATGIPNGLVGPDGELITQAGWCDACNLFHRAHPETNRQCRESNLELMGIVREGEVACCLCKNGLYDYATPIVVEGQQLATLFLGQVLDSSADLEFFRNRAEQFGFDEADYLKAIQTAPVFNKAQMEAHMETMVGVVRILASNGLARLQEERLQSDLNRSTEQRIQMEDLLESSPVGISWCDAEGKIEYVNRQFTEMFGYTLDDVSDLETWIGKAYPVAGYRQAVVEPWRLHAEKAHQSGLALPGLESNIVTKDGRQLRVLARVSFVGEKQLASFTDITAYWLSEQRNRAHNAMLEMVAKAAPLSDILLAIVHIVEEEDPKSLCSVLLLDDEGKHLYNKAAPSLPVFYNEAINGLEIGMGVGSCGTAAYLGERVIVKDIATHDYWQPYAELARRAGLAACWSEPIFTSDGKVLGTFAIYHPKPTVPTGDDIERIAFAANMAAIAIENRNTREALVSREREFRTLAENSPLNIARFDGEGRIIYCNPRLASTVSLPVEELLGTRLSDQSNPAYNRKVLDAVMQTWQKGQECIYEMEMPVKGGGSQIHQIHMVPERDESGAVVGVLAASLDISERKRLERELERQARIDFLTGLYNRRHFIDLAKQELIRLSRYGGELSLILFDIDYFKLINDTYGHNVGDLVLQKIAHLSRENLREIDIIGRIGGEEFVALLPQTNPQQAFQAAERLRRALAGCEIKLENGSILHFTSSFGVLRISSEKNQQGETPGVDDLLTWVDTALYQAKENGRNRVCLCRNCHDFRKSI
jgi:diguanylate cyclase (GGDEF)-like protein/PAS domain S-box-containing protein